MNKSLSIWLRIVTLVLLLTMCFTACAREDDPSEETSADTTTNVLIETSSEEQTTNNKNAKHDQMEKECEYRVLISSDQHYTYKQTWYSVSPEERLQMWVDAVLEEHERRPFDLIILNGDYSLDYWGAGGSVLTDGVCTTEQFVDKYVSQLPDDVPTFILPGNHDAFKDDTWFEMTGNHRQETFKLGNNLFVMMDSFANNLEPAVEPSGGSEFLSPMDTEYLKDQVEANPDCNIYLVSHHFNFKNESDEFKNIIKNNDDIVALFQGHEHKIDVTNLGYSYNNKKIINTGNFSYTSVEDNTLGTFWGFRDLLIMEDYSYSRYIIANSRAQVKGKWRDFTRSIKEPVKIEYPEE